jgi:metal-sulfur cluster biosynthetic enzyme
MPSKYLFQMSKINENPTIFKPTEKIQLLNFNDNEADELNEEEVFELLRHIQDPEHPLTLEELGVVYSKGIAVQGRNIDIKFTPTIPHCSMATLIGLSLRVQLLRTIHEQYKVKVSITPGTHQSESQVNKQLNDKERVCAALENKNLLDVVNQCLSNAIDK